MQHNAAQQTPPADARPTTGRQPRFDVARFLPFWGWMRAYRREDLVGDVMAGVIVAIMLVPQGMAYAMLGGLPPQVGLYAAIAPLALYGLLGTSRTLAVGPVAIVSLMVGDAVGALALPDSERYLTLALTLALLVGMIKLVMGVIRIGFLVNFLSHPVLSGFTSAAALVIAVSQLKHLLGIDMPRHSEFLPQLQEVLAHIGSTNPVTLGIGLGSIALLALSRQPLGRLLAQRGLPQGLITPITRSGPLLVVAFGTLLVALLRLDASADVVIVGMIPTGPPPITAPSFDMADWAALLPAALTLSFVGYMESISVAKSLASRRRQKVDANQELIALGAANLGAAFTGAYPVAGGFGRSVVNFTSGANSGLASLITAGLLLLVVVFLTPLFYFLPRATLAAIVIVAVASLLDVETPRRLWRYSKPDAVALGITFAAVLLVGIESGILFGIGTVLVLYLWRTSRPHIAVVGRIGSSEHFRNVERHDEAHTCAHVAAVRMDESLYFANANALLDYVQGVVAEHPSVDHVLLVCSAINAIDASAQETLTEMIHSLREAGVGFSMAEVKGPVMDCLRRSGFVEALGEEHFYLSTHVAMRALGCRCYGSGE